jgi:V/A-type H+-transporting ATPase subunit E
MRVLDTKAQLIDNAFTEARKRFEKERETVKYKTFLKNLIISAGIQIGGGDIVVKTRKDDQALVAELKGLATAISKSSGQSAKVTKAKKPMDMLGGVFVENKDGNITVDYRIDTLLEQVAQQRRNDIARLLFPSEKPAESPSE